MTTESETKTVDVEIDKIASEILRLNDEGWEIVDSETLDSNADMFRLKLRRWLK